MARSAQSDTLTLADAQQYLRRFPFRGHASLAIGGTITLAANGILLWLLWSGVIGAAALIALVLAETLLLFAIAWVQQRTVPVKDWLEPPKPFLQQLPILVFVLIWLGFAYGITLAMLQQHREFIALFVEPERWIEQQLHWPLAITLGFAAFHVWADHRWYRRHGGPLHSTVAHDAIARYMTLLFGAIPFAMPFLAVVIGGFKAVEYVSKRFRTAPDKSALGGLAMAGVAYGSFFIVERLIESGVSGWAIGYVFAKLLSEWFVIALPLIMVQVEKEERQKAAGGKPGSKRRSNLP